MRSAQALQEIQDGVYLSNDSASNLTSPMRTSIVDKALPDPPPLSHPSRAESRKRSSSVVSPRSIDFYDSRISDVKVHPRDSVYWYKGCPTKAQQQLGIESPRSRRSRLSFTPSSLYVDPATARLSVGQALELSKLSYHDGDMPPISMVDETTALNTEPPDGGTLAWAHAIAGHFIAFNAQ